MDRLQNNSTKSMLKVLQRINYKTIPLESMYSYDDTQIRMDCKLFYFLNECDSKKKVLYWIDSKAILSEYAYKWMRYEVPYQIDSVLVLLVPSICSFLWVTHRSLGLLTDHLPCY